MSGALGPLGIRELSHLSHRLDAQNMTPFEEKRLLFMLDKIFSPDITLNAQEKVLADEILAKIGKIPGKGHYDLFVKYCSHQIKQPSGILNNHSFELLRNWAQLTDNLTIIESVEAYICKKQENPERDCFLELNVTTDISLPHFFLIDPTFATIKLRISSHIHLPEDLRLEQIENSAVYAQIEHPLSSTGLHLLPTKKTDKLSEVTHEDIIYLLKACGFMSNTNGVCQGLAELGCRYLVLGKIHLFDQQIVNISKLLDFLTEDEADLESLTPEELQEACDLLNPNFYAGLKNFLGKIELSIHDSSIFYKELLQCNKPFDDEMDEIGTSYTLLTPEIFVDKLIEFKEIVGSTRAQDTLAICIKNTSHAISIGYDPRKDQWYFIDANRLKKRKFKSEEKLVDFIFSSFRVYPDTLSLTFYSKKNLFPPLTLALENFLQTDPTLALSVEKAQKMPRENVAILLCTASEKGSFKAVEILLQAGANPNDPNLDQQSPLCLACIQNNLDVVKLLVSYGADINYRSSQDDNPFRLACIQNNLEIVDFLIKEGAIIDIQDSQGITALYESCRCGSLELVRLLLEKKANPNIITHFGISPLLIATHRGDIQIIKKLLAYQADINHTAPDGSTPLKIACEEKDIPIIRLLLEKGALDNKPDENGNNLLCLACIEENLEIASLLANNKDSIDHMNRHGFTPLHIACLQDAPQIVSMLLQKGANRDLQTLNGKTPLQIASERGRTDIVALLKQRRGQKRKLPMTGHEELR